MSDYILEMNHISKSFGGVQALKDVSINLKKNEILAIVGENGAGKSTLMKILSGSYPTSSCSGEIIINGKAQNFDNPKDAERAGVEMIYQEISVHLDLSVAENIYMGKLIKNKLGLVDWAEMYNQARKYTQMVGLDVSPREKLRNLSASQQQMVSIAKSLCRNPYLLVLDEPTSPLTESETRILFENLRMLKDKGISCIYISHKMKEVFEIADRITILRDGMHVSTTDKTQIDLNQVIEQMVGRKIDQMFPKEKVQLGEEVLRVEGLTVTHPYSANKNIVENISFSVRKGEILGLAGLVGSGRSETVGAIFGSLAKKSGILYLSSEKVEINNPRDAISRGIGLLTEDRKKTGYVKTMDVSKNITLASLKELSNWHILNQKMEGKVGQTYIEKLSIKTKNLKSSITSLSGGNQQKVVLSKWLMRDLKVIMLDEPTRGIDVGAKVQIYNIMTEIAKSGVAIIMISSELPELLAMSDRLIVLAGGQIRAELSHEEATEEAFMKAATS